MSPKWCRKSRKAPEFNGEREKGRKGEGESKNTAPHLPFSLSPLLLLLSAHLGEVLKILIRFRKDGPGSRRAVHVADVAFLDHRIQNRRRTAIPDPQVTLHKLR